MGLEPFPILTTEAISQFGGPQRDPGSKMEQVASSKDKKQQCSVPWVSPRSPAASAGRPGFSQRGGTPLNLRMMLASRLASPPRLGSST